MLEIEAVRNEVTGMLPYGMQKRIELARALALQPEVILLDEPLAGLESGRSRGHGEIHHRYQ